MTKHLNKTSVTKRIIKVALELKEFELLDLIKRNTVGLYHSDEWEERLDTLVSRGTLVVIKGTGWDRVYKRR